jgi:methylated-DNA-[protein]-cysteine S-methyltransferase
VSDSVEHAAYQSPIGTLILTFQGEAISGLSMSSSMDAESAASHFGKGHGSGLIRETRRQLDAYFQGDRLDFDLPLKLVGTSFQQQVWQELSKIPFGSAISYIELARRVGRPTGSRAVGQANGRNPIALMVPCHRVIAADGGLGGYGGGLDRKRWLLEHEAEVLRHHPEWRADVTNGSVRPWILEERRHRAASSLQAD